MHSAIARKNILVIGGTGIIGRQLIAHLLEIDRYTIHVIALEKESFPSKVRQYIVDRTTENYTEIVSKLNSKVKYWDTVIDIFAFDVKSAQNTYTLFKKTTQHIITLSTTLVYDRTKKYTGPISENSLLAPEKIFGGYVDGKVKMEKFWHSVTDVHWTLLRPYHILGEGSLLGCLPMHNRDSNLLEEIKGGKPLRLCNEGNVFFNYIHPKDIAVIIEKSIGNSHTFNQVYNLVNPEIIKAKDYYLEISRQLKCPIQIENIAMHTLWEMSHGWKMTTLPHIYTTNKLQNAIHFTPNISLKEGIADALRYFQKNKLFIKTTVHERMNKPPHPIKPKWLH